MIGKSKYLYALVLIVLFLPALQNRFPIFKVTPLEGAFNKSEKPKYLKEDWYSGKFQQNYVDFLEDNIGFRSLFVRMSNQLDYSFFNELNAEGIICGKNDVFFEEDYIKEYNGDYFIGKDAIEKKLKHLKFIQEKLNEKGIDLITIFEPGKASFYPELIPDKFNISEKKISNYDLYSMQANEFGINNIDLNKYFLSIKDTCKYLLYPNCGTHWSTYGMYLAADTLMKFIEYQREIDLPEIELKSLELTNKPRFSDNDLEKTMNLIFSISQPELAYPELVFIDNELKTKPDVLIIGDSYYFNIHVSDIPKNVFSSESFWLYNKSVYPETYFKNLPVKSLNLKEEIEKRDVILLMITERFMHSFLWGFIENVYKLYQPAYKEDPAFNYENRIRNFEPWFKKAFSQSKNENKSLSKMITETAEHEVASHFKESENTNGDDYIKFIEWFLRNDKKWVSNLINSAKEKQIDPDSFIYENAVYIYKTIHTKKDNSFVVFRKPERFYKQDMISYFEWTIKNDEKWYNDLVEKSLKENKNIDDIIHENAVWVFNNKDSEK
ncbi:MAG: hypothetical protein K8R41_12365 [Bacteroidales bacterium]|nr:hypothetical protein [Bacteroidales bacterium]